MAVAKSKEVAEVVEGEIVEPSAIVLADKTALEVLIDESQIKMPAMLDGAVVLHDWYHSLAYRAPYQDPDPDRVMRKILLQTANATKVEDLFERSKPLGLQNMVKNEPGAGTGPVRIVDLHVAESDLKGSVPCFMVLTLESMRTGEVVITTTGAQELQMQVLGFITFSVWPIECQIKRMDVKDKGGRYMFRMYPLD